MLGEAWLGWALLSTLCYGLQSFLQRVAREADAGSVDIMMYLVVCVGSTVAIAHGDGRLEDDLWWFLTFAAVQGALYYLTTWSRMKALRERAAVSVVTPLVRLSTVIVIVVSALLLPDEWENLRRPGRLIGILLSLGAAFLLMLGAERLGGERRRLTRIQWILILIAIVASAGASLMAKGAYIVFDEVNVFAFILSANAVALLVAVGRVAQGKDPLTQVQYQRGVILGFSIGAVNLTGVWSFMMALQTGTLSTVASINALYVMVPIVLASIVYRERLSMMRHVAIAMTLVAIALLAG